MSQREGKAAFRPKKGKNQDKKQILKLEEPKKDEERKFVPWLGEARPKWGPIYNFEEKLGSRISMEFLSGRIIEGKLVSYDRFTNLVLEDTVELLDGGNTRSLGKVFTCGRVEAIGPAV